jgi:hypothetical protein|tara:strand:- start:1066 stop:2193 length:1128 start_codon:yes stop_codon:yes gene_type:complete
MAINNEKKSNRLLGGRRYTSADLNTSQEAFTEVLDLRASEIYTQGHLIPESNLPFSGSSQSGITYKVGGNDILKYWYRFRLTKSNVDEDAWFFISPTGSASGVTPQLIQDGQQTNFISPKYSIASLANANTEDTTPGYGVRVYASTSTNSGSLGGGDVISGNDYQFDYKTGVLQFDSARSSNEIVYMSVYQYVGTTLATGLEVDGNITANQYIVSSSVTYMTSSFSSGSTIFGDSVDDTHQFTGSVSISGSILPTQDDLIDLGSSTFEWKDLHLDGTANIDTLSLTDGFTYNGVSFNTSGSGAATGLQVTGSNFQFRANNPDNLFTLKNSSDEIAVQIDDKVIILGEPTSVPTAIKGGMYYSSSAWFLGYENSPT